MLTLTGAEALTECPGCGGAEFTRASLFGSERSSAERDTATGEIPPEGTLSAPAPAGHDSGLEEARRRISKPGDYLCYEEDGEFRTVPLTREWTRIGRSLTADVRFDDQTVSRRHALIVRQPNGVHVHDDRSLNGVFVNGARVGGKPLQDGDEIMIGRYRLTFFSIPATADLAAAPDPPSLGAGAD